MADNDTLNSLYQRLDVKAGSADAQLVSDLYDDAVANVLDFTRRDEMIGSMNIYAKQLAVVAYNRLDTEGEAQRDEGNIDRYFVAGIPMEIQQPLKRYRLATPRGLSS
ncbi:hypothetical protein HC026_11090 [Lactobacillus sp. LC28-10]|uniref:Phage gp6-like head-tail connector protein n=1 Tax=Secundilactobacillus angelensis TaxID=2722706 RepID=A0ABX1KZS2_9LACO|nr:hypothetical protein [Secundilactobacillus angelensis]MCH5463204.1 hypothetical protein [Secundilactobacillus angelensis]NLR19437.1 hypothetical protein [Secundilactobacillus angelensis]